MATARLRLCWILLGLLASSPARAGERVDELYRTTFGAVHRTQVDETDGSVWMLAGANVFHLASDGSVLSVHNPGVAVPEDLLRHPTDGSYWVSGLGSGQVAHVAASGRVLSRTIGLGDQHLCLMHLDPGDGSVTVFEADRDLFNIYSIAEGIAAVVHLSASGAVQWTAPVMRWEGYAAVDTTDGSVWVVNPKAAQHYRVDGYLLWQGKGVAELGDVVVDPADGSCWYSDQGYYVHAVVHLAANGAELSRYSAFQYPAKLALDAHDGSVWAIDKGQGSTAQPAAVHLAADGTLLGRYTNLLDPGQLLVSEVPTGSVWVSDTGYVPHGTSVPAVVHLAADGSELWRATDFDRPFLSGINRANGSVWISDVYAVAPNPALRRVTAEGQEAFRITVGWPWDLSVDPRDDSCWFGGNGTPMHVSATGEVLWQHREIWLGAAIAGNAHTGARWVEDRLTGEVVSLTPEGAEQWRRAAPLSDGSQAWGYSLSADSPDGSGWVAAHTPPPCSGPGDKLYHLAENGAELWSVPDMHGIGQIAGNRSDGSCWVLEWCDTHSIFRLTRFAADGTRLWTLDPSPGYGISVNPADGSAWLGSGDHLTHLSVDGVVLGTTPAVIGKAGSPAVNPLDGSAWVYDIGAGCLVHFSATSELLLRTGRVVEHFGAGPAVDASDGSVWVCELGDVIGGIALHYDALKGSKVLHLAPDGTELWRGTNFNDPSGIWVHPSDHTVWVNDTGNNQLVRLGAVRSPFLDLPADSWAFDYIRACVNAGIVSGYPDGTYRPTLPVTRDQMAVFISRALAGGDANVPTGPATATFPDVLTDHWAFRYVEYAVSHGVTGGYPDGTYRPTETVTRDQMAVFIARAMVGGDAYVPPGPATAYFPDVPTDFWAFKYIEYIKNQGVTGGYPDGTYRPAVVVTRDQMAVFVARAFELPM